MSISGAGAYGSGGPSQMLTALLSKLDQSSASSTATSADVPSSAGATSANTLAGSSKPSLSSMILGALMVHQQQSSTGATQGSQPATDPLQSLFTAMDSDSDGAVSKSELESYIQQQGGTSTEADSLYTMLGGSDDQGISESDLASSMPKPPGPPPGGPQAGDAGGADLLSMLDTDKDGTVSKSEFEGFVTSNDGTTTEADTDFTALDSSDSGSLSSSDFSKALQTIKDKANDGSYAPLLTLLDAFAKGTTTGGTVSLTA